MWSGLLRQGTEVACLPCVSGYDSKVEEGQQTVGTLIAGPVISAGLESGTARTSSLKFEVINLFHPNSFSHCHLHTQEKAEKREEAN